MKLAIRGHDLGKKGDISLAESLDRFGFDAVQLVPYKTYADIAYDPSITEARASEIYAELQGANKEVALIGAYFNPVHSDKKKVENGKATFKRYIELAKVFHTSLVGSETGSFNDDKWTYNPLNRTEEAFETVVETFGELADYAAERGVNVGMEGAAGHVMWNPKRLNRAVEKIGRKNIRIIFDLFNYLDETNVEDYMKVLEEGLEIFSGRIHCYHIKDCAVEGGAPKRVGVGKGIFDFNRILPMIKKENPDATLVFEGSVGDEIAPGVGLIKKIWSEI